MIKRTFKTISRQEAENAAAQLGVADLDYVTEESLRTAWRAKVRQSHPDVSGITPDEAVAALHKLTLARATLLLWLAQQPRKDCRTCRGRGSVRSGPFGTRPCPSC